MRIFDWFKKNSSQKNKSLYANGVASKQYILSLIREISGITVLEAGASGGEDTLEWASKNEVSNVFAFEPVEYSYNSLKNKVKDLYKVKTFNLALSDKNGDTIINISENTQNPKGLPSSSSILTPSGHLDFHKHITFSKQQKVKLVTIDDWAHQNGINKIDIMWLDMQGAEHLALKGAAEMLKTTKIIYSEVSLKPMYSGGLLYSEFRELLSDLGFKVEKEYLPWEDMGNVLFTKK